MGEDSTLDPPKEREQKVEAVARRFRWWWLGVAGLAVYATLFLAHVTAGHSLGCGLGLGVIG